MTRLPRPTQTNHRVATFADLLTASTAYGGAAGACIPNSFGGGSTKYSCVAGSAAVSSLPAGLVAQLFNDGDCKTPPYQAFTDVSCTVAGGVGSVSTGCSATESYSLSYPSSTTCTGTNAKANSQPLTKCTTAFSGIISSQACNVAAPAKSGAAGTAAGVVAAVAAAAAVAVLA